MSINDQIRVARELGVIEGMGKIMAESGTSDATKNVGERIIKIVAMIDSALGKVKDPETVQVVIPQQIEPPTGNGTTAPVKPIKKEPLKPYKSPLTDEERRAKRNEYQKNYLAKKRSQVWKENGIKPPEIKEATAAPGADPFRVQNYEKDNASLKSKIVECGYEYCSGRSTFLEGTGVELGMMNFCSPICRDLFQKREDDKLSGESVTA